MPWSHPAPRMREYVLALRAIWRSWTDGGKLDFDGEFYRHTLMTPMFSPGPLASGPPLVQIAAVGDAMTQVAGEVADGLIVHSFTTRRYLREVDPANAAAGLDRAGRAREDIDIVYAPFVVTGTDEKEMAASAAVARERIAFYASTPAYRAVLELHGWGDLQTSAERARQAGQVAGDGEPDRRRDACRVRRDRTARRAARCVRPMAERAGRPHRLHPARRHGRRGDPGVPHRGASGAGDARRDGSTRTRRSSSRARATSRWSSWTGPRSATRSMSRWPRRSAMRLPAARMRLSSS